MYRMKTKKNAYILFTREPIPGKTKTRLMPYFTGEQCAELHKCFLMDIRDEMKRLDADIVVAYTGGKPEALTEIFGESTPRICQRGADIWEKMDNAIADTLALGYERAVLTGADIPELKSAVIAQAFKQLEASDVVLAPTSDGGYYLVGMNERHREVFSIETAGPKSVFEATHQSAEDMGLKVSLCDSQEDIDTPEDLADYRCRMRSDRKLRRTHTGRYLAHNTKVSIIVPTYNEKETIDSMLCQLRPLRHEAEIIFVDGGSSDGTLTRVENAGSDFKIIRSGKGRGSQLNRGAEAATGDILFFLHCDSKLPAKPIEQIRKVMMSHDWGYFGVKFPSNNFFMITNRMNSNLRASAGRIVFGDQGIFIDRKVFKETGGFPDIPIMEDYSFSLKLRKLGIKPGRTSHRLETSPRRYGKGTFSILKTELLMFNLRRKFRRGTEPEELASIYRDIR